MRIVVDVNHPAHVHCFRNFIREMEEKGHEVMITATRKDISLKLLDNLGHDYVNLGSYGNTLLEKLFNLPVIDIRMYKAVKKFDPDVFIGLGSIRATHVSFALHKRSIVIDDTEISREQMLLFMPFVDIVCTPAFFRLDLGKKQVRFNAYKELAYLHPRYFRPDPGVLDALGLKRDERFIVVRFVAWGASHDVGHHGITDRLSLVRELEQYGRVFVSSEAKPGPEFDPYRIDLPPEKFHDLLYYASLFVGEGGTTATEAALLGTHSILIDTSARQCGNYYDLSSYGLLWFTGDTREGLDIAKSLLKDPDLQAKGKLKRQKLLSEKIDVNQFMVWLVENYPASVEAIKADPDVQYRFRQRIGSKGVPD
jgi:predicted glycosyltransferase